MAVGGVIITVVPSDKREVELSLSKFSELQIYGSDEEGNIIATIKSLDEHSIKMAIEKIERLYAVLQVKIAYLKNDDTPCDVD